MTKSNAPNYISKKGFARLQEEFRVLFNVERPKVVETVAWAAGNGDRSENGDYIYGKRRLREIDKRLKFLKDRLEAAQIVDIHSITTDKVVFGASVTLLDEDGNEKTYQIVGEDETEPSKNRISWRAPMASAVLGKKIGDEVSIKRPAGLASFEVVAIRIAQENVD